MLATLRRTTRFLMHRLLHKGRPPTRAVWWPACRQLNQRYPGETDRAVNQYLRQGREGGQEDEAKQRVMAFLRTSLAGSGRAPLASAGTTLFLAVDAPAAHIRQMVSHMHCKDPAPFRANAASPETQPVLVFWGGPV